MEAKTPLSFFLENNTDGQAGASAEQGLFACL
jgi:hypothetical protein